MKKLEKEQMPKVIALGVTVTGLLGYLAFTRLGHGGAPAPAVAATPHSATQKPAVKPAPQPVNPVLALAPVDHENPFIPAFQTTSAPAAPKPVAAKPAAAKPAPKPVAKHSTAAPATMLASLPDTLSGPAMDGLPAVAPPPAPVAPTPPQPQAKPRPVTAPPRPPAATPTRPKARPVAAGPTPPAVVVTGILEGQENVAILKWSDTKRQVVRIGDHLDGGYVVKEIRSDAVVLSLGARQWVVQLGAESKNSN